LDALDILLAIEIRNHGISFSAAIVYWPTLAGH
jgi:hypothetical protein